MVAFNLKYPTKKQKSLNVVDLFVCRDKAAGALRHFTVCTCTFVLMSTSAGTRMLGCKETQILYFHLTHEMLRCILLCICLFLSVLSLW